MPLNVIWCDTACVHHVTISAYRELMEYAASTRKVYAAADLRDVLF